MVVVVVVDGELEDCHHSVEDGGPDVVGEGELGVSDSGLLGPGVGIGTLLFSMKTLLIVFKSGYLTP